MNAVFLAVGVGLVALGVLNALRFWRYGVAFYEWQWRHYDRLADGARKKTILGRVYFAIAGPSSRLRGFNRSFMTLHYRWIVSALIVGFGAIFIAQPFR